jgi:hypothetical protein
MTKTPRRAFIGDWPVGYATSDGHTEVRPGGVGPARVEEMCESCERPIATTGECGCSA